MSARRSIRAAGLVALAVLVCLAVVLVLPPVQLRLVRALLGAPEQSGIALGYVSAGPGGVAIRDLSVVTPTLVLTVARADIDLKFWSSLTHLRVDVESASLSGVDVRAGAGELTPRPETPSEASPFTGLRAQAKVPRWLRVRALDAAGTVTLAPNPELAIAGPWELAVSGISADATASVRLGATLDTRRADEVVATSVVAIDTTAEIRRDSQIARLALAADVRPLGADAGLRAVASADLEDTERYVLDLTGRTGVRVAHAEAALSPDGRFEGRWEASLTPGVVAAFARGRSVADLSGGSTGEIRMDLRSGSADLRSSTHIQGRGWEAFDPRLAGLGPLEFELDVDGAIASGEVAANDVRAAIRSAERGDLLTLRTLQPLRFGTESWHVEPARVGEPALRLQANDLPLRWIRRLVPAAAIEAGQVSGAIDVVRDAAQTLLVVTAPVKATGVTLAPVGDTSLPPFDLTLTPRATMGGGALVAEIEELTLTVPSTGGAVVLRGRSATSRADWPNVSFDGEVTARLPRLQRLVPELDAVHAAAQMSVDFSTLTLALASATITAGARDGRELVGADLSGNRPLRVALRTLAIDWDAFEPQTASLHLDRLPIAWLSPYVPEVDFRSGEVSGQFTAVARQGAGLRLETGEPLVVANLLPVYRGREARQTLTATIRPALLLSNAAKSLHLRELHFSTPNGNRLDGEIAVDMPTGKDRAAVSISLDGDFAPFARRYGAQIGRMRWRQESEIETDSRRLHVSELDLRFEDTTGSGFFELTSLRPFYVTSEPLSVGVDGGSPRILHATVTPLRLEGLLPNIFGFDLEGVLPQGEFFGTAEPDGHLRLAAEQPLVFRDVTVRWQDATLLDRVTMSVLYDVAYAADGFQARSVDLTAAGPDGHELLRTSSRVIAPLQGDRLVESAQIAVHANLARMNEQPVLANVPPFTSGALEASLDFINQGEAKLAFGAKIQSAALASGPLPDLDVRLDATGVRGDRVQVTLPVRLESASGVSDLKFDGSMARRKDGAFDFTAALAGSRVVIRDVRQLFDLVAPPKTAVVAEQNEAAPVTREERATAIAKLRSDRHTVPAWTEHFLGSARVDVARIEFPSLTVDGLRGTLDVTRSAATLRELRASVLGASLQAAATVDFDAARPKPYGLDFHAEIADLELQRLFRAIAPDTPPTAEGRFDFETTLTGSGLNPIDLGLSSLGEMRLTGTDGVFRGLAAYAGTGATATRVIGILTFSRELKAIGRLLDGLGELHFRQAEIRLDRKTPERIDLSVLSVVSPQLRLDATGSLSVGPQQPLLTSPLEVSAQLAARGDIAIVFDGMGLLQKEAGSAGYRELTRRVDIRGTAAEPDATAFWELLDEGASNARGSFGAGLRALNSRLESAPSEPR